MAPTSRSARWRRSSSPPSRGSRCRCSGSATSLRNRSRARPTSRRATDAQWAAALARAESCARRPASPTRPWWVIAKGSDDPGSAARGGDLGWYDPSTSTFVPEFKAAVARLNRRYEPADQDAVRLPRHPGHRERTTAPVYAEQMVAALRAHPDVRRPPGTRARTPSAPQGRGARLGHPVPGRRSSPTRSSAHQARRDQRPGHHGKRRLYLQAARHRGPALGAAPSASTVRTSGFDRWLAELRDEAGTWTDPSTCRADRP